MAGYQISRRAPTGTGLHRTQHGEVSEWLIELVSKTSVPFTVPRVRIPPCPFSDLETQAGKDEIVVCV